MTNLDKPLETNSQKSNKLIYLFTAISLIGFLDAVYLTVSHYTGHISCSVITGCQEVLTSQYSEIFGIPLALLGAAYYLFILISSLIYIDNQNKYSKLILSYIPITGFLFSLYLVYLMFFVINALCQYCLLSATTSTLLFILGIIFIKKDKIKQ
jgi:uncharacterized membrane protein